MRVLICDDTEMIRKTMRMFLEKAGHEVVAECGSGNETIALYPSVRPDVCLLDIAMPGMDGIATLKGLLTIDPYVKAIMCTARDDQHSMTESIESGAIDYIEKPFTPTRLNEALAKIQI